MGVELLVTSGSMKTLDLRRQNSSMGICADENSTTRCAEVMSSARQVGEIISSSSVGGSDPPTNLSTLKLVGLVERLHGDFLQLAYRSIQSRREAADALRVQRARDDAEKARQKAAVASAVLDLHYSPHSRKSKAVDAEQQKLVLTQIRHPPLGYPSRVPVRGGGPPRQLPWEAAPRCHLPFARRATARGLSS